MKISDSRPVCRKPSAGRRSVELLTIVLETGSEARRRPRSGPFLAHCHGHPDPNQTVMHQNGGAMNDRTNQGRDNEAGGTFERMGEQVGEAAGRAFERGGEMAGGMLGSMLDSAANTLGAWWSSTDADRAARGFSDNDEHCRRHFESGKSDGVSRRYDEVRPLYQFGHMASRNPDYQGRDFSEVEPDLRRALGSDSKWGPTDWSDAREYVDFGFSAKGRDAPGDL